MDNIQEMGNALPEQELIRLIQNNMTIDRADHISRPLHENDQINCQNNKTAQMKDLAIHIHTTSPEHHALIATKYPELVTRVRDSLLASNPIERKQALYILKCLTSSVASNQDSFGHNALNGGQEVLLDLTYNVYLKFWMDFFELFEILDETQIHIIEPFLPKLDKMLEVNSCSSAAKFLSWYFILLKKMTQHENRSVVERGILDFFKARQLMTPDSREDFFQFITSSVLPAVKKNVGWIFPDAKNFFSASTEMGILLHEKYRADIFSLIQLVLGFIEGFGNGMSPLSIYFLVGCVRTSIRLLPVDTVVPMAVFTQSLQIINGILMRCLTTIDKFIGSQIQKYFVDIFCDICRLTEISSTAMDVLEFLGLLDRETVVTHRDAISEAISANFINNFELNLDDSETELSKNKKLGYFRFLFLDYSSTAVQEFNTLKYCALVQQTSKVSHYSDEFLRCILLCEKSNEELWRYVMGNSMLACLKYWNYKFDRVEDSIDTPSSEVLDIQELILKFSYDFLSDTETELIPLNNQVFEHLKSRTLGNDIYEDSVTLRLLTVATKLRNRCSKDASPSCPLEGFENIFLKTKLEHYGKISPKPDTSFLSQFYEVRMKALTVVLEEETLLPCKLSLSSEILESIIDEVDTGGPTGINFAMEFFISALSAFQREQRLEQLSQDSLENFVHISWAHLFEMRKTEAFWIGLKNFVKLICHPYFLNTDVLNQYADEIFKKGELVTGIPLILTANLSRLDRTGIKDDRLNEIMQICTKATYFGNALHKTNRVTFSIFDYLGKLDDAELNCNAFGPNAWNNPEFIFNADSKMRIIGVFTIVASQLDMGMESGSKILESVIDQLLDANQAESRKHRIYFGNSVTHRVKHRIAQALLVLQPLYNEELARKVTSSLFESLALDCPQPSVRYYMEWIIMRNLLKYSNFHNQFFDVLRQACKKRAGVATFVCSICFHVALRIDDPGVLQTFCDKSLRLLTNFLTGQHLTVRVYAQICFSKIFNRLSEVLGNTSPVLEKFEVLQESLVSGSLTSGGNYFKMALAMKKDFWIEIFDPVADFNPEAIFIYIPRMSGMSYDEIIRRDDLTEVLSDFDLDAMKCAMEIDFRSASTEKYAGLELDSFHLKPPSGDGRELGEIYPLESPKENAPEIVSNLQRKINPWKVLPVSEDLIADFPQELQTKKKAISEEGLIVVASLIDRIPNLGGLCRSCEIFGVSKYVISSLHLLEDQEFKSLSVTAHSWIDVIEVPPKDLESFLSTYSAKGYSILGIEQAIGSVSLNQYKFPKKAVLLLGNEKLGIPTNLLHLVDQCLEIPQVGVVRSLNVHVTGALCIWQYASQHIIGD